MEFKGVSGVGKPPAERFEFAWFRFDNHEGTTVALTEREPVAEASMSLPSSGSQHLMLEVRSIEESPLLGPVRVFVRNDDMPTLIGLERRR